MIDTGIIRDLFIRDAKVVNVVDGDTLDADVDLGYDIGANRQRFRILGIDAPEKVGLTKEAGLAAKQFVLDKCSGKEITIVSRKKDGFRRYLGVILVNEDDGSQTVLSDVMIEEGYAIPRTY